MALIPSTLTAGLSQLQSTTDEASAINVIVSSYINFMSSAMCGPIPIVPAALHTTPKLAAMAALTGFSQQNQAATSISNAIAGFWAAMVPLAATLFPTATVITPPPTVGTIGGLANVVFSANTSGNMSLPQAAQTLAQVIYGCSQGGMATIPTPTPTPTPIA